jgi:hypothetical protein
LESWRIVLSECGPFQDKVAADFFSYRNLQRQLELAQKRNHQLNDVIEANKVAEASPPG